MGALPNEELKLSACKGDWNRIRPRDWNRGKSCSDGPQLCLQCVRAHEIALL
jgi:hypothetical protein